MISSPASPPLAAEATLELEAFLPYRLSVLADMMTRQIARTYEHRHDLSVGEWRLIAVLARFGPLSANAVAARTAMDKVRISRAVARAGERGLIDRTVDGHDRRRSVLTLTEAGRALHARIASAALAEEAALLAALTPEEARSLSALLAQLEARAAALASAYGMPGGTMPD